jgi:UDP-hydrolysing UDP-N-acetyl-D-glucosamine 2-epimerase
VRVVVITGSRADWNGLGMVAMALRDAGQDVQIIATGQHVYGRPKTGLDVLIEDGFDGVQAIPGPVDRSIADALTDAPLDVARASGWLTISIANALGDLKPDLVMLAGDRYETLAGATAATLVGIPIAHLAGGDVTEGSMDDKFRNAISMMASLHFATNRLSADRLRRMEVSGAVHDEGSPALDRIRVTPIVTRETLFNQLASDGFNPCERNVLVAFHPATVGEDPTRACAEMLHGLTELDAVLNVGWLMLGSNADAGAKKIEDMLRTFIGCCENGGAFVHNLPPQQYYSALAHFDLMVGNSSAGVYETAGFGIPVINVGTRQAGRIAPANVIGCPAKRERVLMAAKLMLGTGRMVCKNPYGDGYSAKRIAQTIGEWQP